MIATTSALGRQEDVLPEFAELKDKINIVQSAHKARIEANPPIVLFVKDNLPLMIILIALVLLLFYFFLNIIFNIFYLLLG